MVNTTKTRATISTQQTTKVLIVQTNSSSTITSETVIKQNNTTPLPLIARPSSTHADDVIRETSTKVPRLTTETRYKDTETTETTETRYKDSIHEARNEKATSESVFVIVGVIASVIVIGCSAVAAGFCCYRKKWWEEQEINCKNKKINSNLFSPDDLLLSRSLFSPNLSHLTRAEFDADEEYLRFSLIGFRFGTLGEVYCLKRVLFNHMHDSILGAGPILRVALNQGLQTGIAFALQTARPRGTGNNLKWRGFVSSRRRKNNALN